MATVCLMILRASLIVCLIDSSSMTDIERPVGEGGATLDEIHFGKGLHCGRWHQPDGAGPAVWHFPVVSALA